MATGTFLHDGDSIDYTPMADVAAGQVVVMTDLVGIAKQPIAANKLGSLAVTGVFELPKSTAAGITIGVLCYWDAANQRVSTVETGNTYLGKCVKTADTTDPTVQVRLSQ